MNYEVQKVRRRKTRRAKNRKRRGRKTLFIFKYAIVILVISFTVSSIISNNNMNDELNKQTQAASFDKKTANEQNKSSNDIVKPAITLPNNKGEVENEKDVDTKADNDNYNYSIKVPENNVIIDDEYFENTLFIGNSRTEGLFLYSAPKGATFYTHEGLLVNNALSKKIVRIKNKKDKVSIKEALLVNKYENVYVMFGTNELGWVSTSIFIEEYKKIINEIKKHNPNANIYVQSILPVSKKKSNSTKIYTNSNILKFNSMILKMCEEIKVYYLDAWESVADSSGVLPKNASVDGVHLTKKYTNIWLDYIKKHSVEEKNLTNG